MSSVVLWEHFMLRIAIVTSLVRLGNENWAVASQGVPESALDFQTLRIRNAGPKHQGLFCWFMAESHLSLTSLKFSPLYSLHWASQTQMTPELSQLTQVAWATRCNILESGRAEADQIALASPWPLSGRMVSNKYCQSVYFFKRNLHFM